MEKLIKKLRWLCQTYSFAPAHSIELMKIQELQRISNTLSAIESRLSDLVEFSQESGNSNMAADEAELDKFMKSMGVSGDR